MRAETSAVTAADWSPESWRARPALHQPAWPDPAERDQVTKALRDLPPLVFAGEARSLSRRQFPQEREIR